VQILIIPATVVQAYAVVVKGADLGQPWIDI
jgi:hypothetical protein